MKKIIDDLLDNRYINILFLPIAIYNIIISYITTKKEFNIFVDVLNKNDDFFKALGTLGFYPNGNRMYFETNLDVEDGLSMDEVRQIANTTIIAIVMKYVKSEFLLGVVNIECLFTEKNKVRVIIRPASLKLLVNDIYDMIFSTIITVFIVSALIFLF